MFSFSHGVHVCFQADKLGIQDVAAAQRLLDAGPIYYTRTRGLFRECFLGQKEPGKNQTHFSLGTNKAEEISCKMMHRAQTNGASRVLLAMQRINAFILIRAMQ